MIIKNSLFLLKGKSKDIVQWTMGQVCGMLKAWKEISAPLRYAEPRSSQVLHASFLPCRTCQPSAETQLRTACRYFWPGFPSFLRKESISIIAFINFSHCFIVAMRWGNGIILAFLSSQPSPARPVKPCEAGICQRQIVSLVSPFCRACALFIFRYNYVFIYQHKYPVIFF